MPREPNIAESAKQRSLRVPLDHYERPTSLVRAKWWLSAAAGAIAIAYVAWLLFGSRAAQRHASPGPVAAAHASWNDDCQACHLNAQPLRADAVSLATLAGSPAANRDALDRSCRKCHHAPDHHAAAKTAEVPSCAACHREHQGSAADIARPADASCLNCHRDIEHHRDGPSRIMPAPTNVTGFGPAPSGGSAPHPDFRSLTSDPGNIKFNHWLHLQPGIATTDAKQKLKLQDLDAAVRAKYRADPKSGDLVQLDCGACHQPRPDGGATMQPIAYEQHCRACHKLEWKSAEGPMAVHVPHGLSAERLTVVLDGLLFTAERRRQDLTPPTADESGQLPLVPGKTLGRNLAQKISHDVLGMRASAARAIEAKCDQCHVPRQATSASSGDLHDFLPANIPATWLRHAHFDHRAHRHLDCRGCHAEAYAFEQRDKPHFLQPAAGLAAARDDQQVMIAGLSNCAACHAPAQGSQGGARHDCAECHNYHGGDATAGQAFNPRPHSSPTSFAASFPYSFPGSALGTPDRQAPASSLETIRLTALSVLETQQPRVVGAAACASAGCHGDVRDDAPRWRTSFTTWAARDPHAQAYEVLWTYRAREMTRLLGRRAAITRPPANFTSLSDDQHRQVIQERCIGCHATPAPHDEGATAGSHALAVSCQSCHGPASEWLHAHDKTNFARASTAGFVDTKGLGQRAGVCMACHVGPNELAGPIQVVDHDLIAAGHPRLAFEFQSYFESLPAHWDRQMDQARHPKDFHFRLWMEGQLAMVDQRKLLPAKEPPDFAQFDCFACHHRLAENAWRQTSHSTSLTAVYWPKLSLSPLTERTLPVAERLLLADVLLTDAATHDVRWDNAVQSFLAARAIAADLTSQTSGDFDALNSALANLGYYLAKDCFPGRERNALEPTAYDSPTAFDPQTLVRHLKPMNEALRRLLLP